MEQGHPGQQSLPADLPRCLLAPQTSGHWGSTGTVHHELALSQGQDSCLTSPWTTPLKGSLIRPSLWLPTTRPGAPITKHLAHLAETFAGTSFHVILSYPTGHMLLWPRGVSRDPEATTRDHDCS